MDGDWRGPEEATDSSSTQKPGTVTVAGKPGVDVPPGTLNAVLKQARLKE